MSRSRDYCYTLNNYTEGERDALRALACVYMVFGYERGESGTPHLQGYVRFKCQKTLSAVKKVMPRAHWETRKGTVEQAIAYCMKEGDFEEFGVKPMTQKEKGACNKRRYEEAWELAKQGRIEEIDADLRIRHLNTLKKIREDFAPKPDKLSTLDNEWIYGPTGTGKTRGAWERYPDAYCKTANTLWWDGYNGEDVVIIDDFDKYHVKEGFDLKIWGDHNPFQAQRKGGNRLIRPKKIIVTSNYHPREIWDDEQTVGPICRRFRVVKMEKEEVGTIPAWASGCSK